MISMRGRVAYMHDLHEIFGRMLVALEMVWENSYWIMGNTTHVTF